MDAVANNWEIGADAPPDEAMRAVGQYAAQEGLNMLRSMAISFGLPATIAHTLQLTWTGSTFTATSPHPGLKEYEYGDGKTPPKAPVRKAMKRLEPKLLALMESRLDAEYDFTPQARF